MTEVKEFSKNFLVKEQLVTDRLAHITTLKVGREVRSRERKSKKSDLVPDTTVIENDDESASDNDSETAVSSESDSETEDTVMNVVEDSDSEDEAITVVPAFKTVTRHGRIAGTWRRFMNETSPEPENNESNSVSDDHDNTSESESEKSTSESDNEVTNSDVQPSSDSEENEMCTTEDNTFTITRSGRRAGRWNRWGLEK